MEGCRELSKKTTILVSPEERLEAVSALGELGLPVGSPEQMEEESVPTPEEILG